MTNGIWVFEKGGSFIAHGLSVYEYEDDILGKGTRYALELTNHDGSQNVTLLFATKAKRDECRRGVELAIKLQKRFFDLKPYQQEE